MESFNDREIESAIETALSSIIEQVLWYLADEKEMSSERAIEIINDSDGADTAAIGLRLDQMLSIVEEAADACGYDELTFPLDTLRSQLESYAAHFIHLLAASRAHEIFTELFDFMDCHGLEPEQMREANDYSCFAHVAEREEDPFTIYEYRNVEGSDNHVDVWEYQLASGWRVFFHVSIES